VIAYTKLAVRAWCTQLQQSGKDGFKEKECKKQLQPGIHPQCHEKGSNINGLTMFQRFPASLFLQGFHISSDSNLDDGSEYPYSRLDSLSEEQEGALGLDCYVVPLVSMPLCVTLQSG